MNALYDVLMTPIGWFRIWELIGLILSGLVIFVWAMTVRWGSTTPLQQIFCPEDRSTCFCRSCRSERGGVLMPLRTKLKQVWCTYRCRWLNRHTPGTIIPSILTEASVCIYCRQPIIRHKLPLCADSWERRRPLRRYVQVVK